MRQTFDAPIDEIKHYLSLQLEAYLGGDDKLYKEFEVKILEIEKKL